MDVVEQPKEEPKEEPKEVPQTDSSPTKQKIKKVVELVNCPKCDKQLSEKSLRYSHEKSCPGQKIDRSEIPVKRRSKSVPPPIDRQPEAQQEKTIEQLIMTKRQQMINAKQERHK